MVSYTDMVQATVNSVITLPKEEIPENILNEIRGALLMANPMKAVAQREKIGGWWIDDYIHLYEENDSDLIIPRGFANQLVAGFDHYGLELSFADNRIDSPSSLSCESIRVRDYQDRAISDILLREQGVWESPPGSGKTVGVLEAIRRSGQRSLVITDKTNIAEQWRQRANSFLGISVGILGDGKSDIRDITIALQQTLWAKKDELLNQGFFSSWGFICLDECHHLPANTFTEILGLFPAKYRIGVSGTPYKKEGMEDLVWNTLGPRIHKTDKDTLVKGGWLIKPSVKVHRTNFKYDFWPTHKRDKKQKKCSFVFCTRDQEKVRHQNNYSEMMTELVRDDERNRFIARNVAREFTAGHTVIVLSKRLAHLKTLHKLVADFSGTSDGLFQFTGKQSTKQRMEIQERADSGGCVLFSTIADEALDIPRISRIHLAWPTANTGTIEQQMGRGERPHPDKKDFIINDYWDRVGPLTRQFRDREEMVYYAQGLTIDGGE